MSMHSVAEARDQFSTLIDRALNGEEVVITRHGHPVVELKAVVQRGRPMTEEDIQWLRSRRVGRRIEGLDAGQFVSDMRDEDDERLLRR
ncbi:MAG: type II toxin-antitoxin system Phd/YefM family antitoxin [Caulobacteraceae bacterium]